MSLSLNSSSSKKSQDFGRVPDDSYSARIVQVIDLGLQHETFWKNGEPLFYFEDRNKEGYATKADGGDGNPVIKHKVWITFELLTEFVEIDGEQRPRWYSKEYVVSTHEKSAMSKLIAATGAKINSLADLLGQAVLVEIGSSASGKAKIAGVNKIPKMMGEQPPLQNETVAFDVDSPDMSIYEALPDFLKRKMSEGIYFGKSKLAKLLGTTEAEAANEEYDDDIPF